MFVTNGELFDTVKFSPFIGSRIYKAGSPIFSISSDRELGEFEKWVNFVLFGERSNYATTYEFLNNDLLHEAMIKLPFYIRAYLKLKKMLKRDKK